MLRSIAVPPDGHLKNQRCAILEQHTQTTSHISHQFSILQSVLWWVTCKKQPEEEPEFASEHEETVAGFTVTAPQEGCI